MLKLDRIITFLTVIEANSFSGAAQKLSISIPAVSKQIHALETNLGTQLIKRTTRRLSLTEAGQAYYNQCKRMMLEVEETEGLASSLHHEPRGTLRAFISHYFGRKYVIPYLKEFSSLCPKVKLDLEFGERIPDPKDDLLDLIFGVSIAGPENWIQKKLRDTRYVFCASPAYLKLFGTPKLPKDLTQHHYIQHSMRRPDNVLEFNNGEVIHISPGLSINDTQSMLECAMNDLGIVQLHDYVVVEGLESGRLVEILGKYSKSNVPIFIYYRSNRFPQPKIRKFIDYFSKKVMEIDLRA